MVKVFATMRYPDPFKPWTKQAPSEVTGSGVVIEGKRILTNAHVVLYASQVQIQANAAGDKVAAKRGGGCAGHRPGGTGARRHELSSIRSAGFAREQAAAHQGHRACLRFPDGRRLRSRSPRASSRESSSCPISSRFRGLRIQVDAAINPGNSGGPAIAGDKMIGLAFRKQSGEREHRLHHPQRRGRAVPQGHRRRPLRRQARDVRRAADSRESRDARIFEARQVRRGHGRAPPDKSDAAYPLKEWDVITRIGDTPIDNQGMVKLDRICAWISIMKSNRSPRTACCR